MTVYLQSMNSSGFTREIRQNRPLHSNQGFHMLLYPTNNVSDARGIRCKPLKHQKSLRIRQFMIKPSHS